MKTMKHDLNDEIIKHMILHGLHTLGASLTAIIATVGNQLRS